MHAAKTTATPQRSNAEGARNAHDFTEFMLTPLVLITLHSKLGLKVSRRAAPDSRSCPAPRSGADEAGSYEPYRAMASAPKRVAKAIESGFPLRTDPPQGFLVLD